MMSPPLPQELLRCKRDGGRWDEPAIRQLVAGMTDGQLGDAQMGALAMAVYLRGMDAAETLALTLAMRDSGTVIDWREAALPGPLLDKHSTGGVGDLTSLVLAPMVAACGGFLPMLSGRGLGHTGGTLDKLEAIPGYRTQVDIATLKRVTARTGLAIVGAGGGLAPADRRLYVIRDVTATVESIPLVTASILSKKLAAGPQALVLDVKQGSGAGFPDPELSLELAHSLVDIARAAGLPAVALLTDMDEPLVPDIGNAIELRVALDYLSGRRTPPRLHALTLALGREMLRAGGLATTDSQAEQQLVAARDSGRAAERFQAMVAALGGPGDLLDAPERHLPRAPITAAVPAPATGHIAAIDATALGMAVVALGGGRSDPSGQIDPAVGLCELLGKGEPVVAGQPLARVHARERSRLEEAIARVQGAYRIDTIAPPPGAIIRGRITTPEETPCAAQSGW
jgi:thymidine phosphorylase